MKKKLFIIIAASLIASVYLTACGNKTTQTLPDSNEISTETATEDMLNDENGTEGFTEILSEDFNEDESDLAYDGLAEDTSDDASIGETEELSKLKINE